jgi:hypothetical protein
VGAQCHQEIELPGIVQELDHHPEQSWQGQRARVIGDQSQDPLVCEPASQALG